MPWERIHAIAAKAGEHAAAIPELFLYHRTTPTSCYRASDEPSLSVFVQGRKRIILGCAEYVCDGSSFLLSSIDMPAQSRIIEASVKTPLLVMFIRFNMPTVREVLSRDDIPEAKSSHRQGLAVGKTTVACSVPVSLLKTPQADRLRAIATSGDLSQRTTKAIAWLRANFAKPLHMQELADTARMGLSTLHHQFHSLTAMSPL